MIDTFAAGERLEILGYQGACIPEYDGWTPARRRLGRVPVHLVGDAAGHVKVTTIGGLVNGLWGAEGAVEHLAGRRRLRSSYRSLRGELGLHLLIRRVLHTFSTEDYRELLAMLDDVSRATLGRIERDRALALVIRLLLRRPRFASLALKGLFRSVQEPAFRSRSRDRRPPERRGIDAAYAAKAARDPG
jgi:flavin-dependent dehydrogenase